MDTFYISPFSIVTFIPPFIPAVRFGRIPKREKQRLLDEMQSYMNSLNESASMDITCTTPTETPSSPEDGQSEEAIGVISQAYHNIFVNGEKLLVKINDDNNINNNNPSSFRHNPIQESGYRPQPSISPQDHSIHSTTSCLPQSRCPFAKHDSKPTTQVMDNSHYNFPQSSSPSQGTTPSQSYPSKHNSYSTQTSCPWRLSPGAKVLVCFFMMAYDLFAGLCLLFSIT